MKISSILLLKISEASLVSKPGPVVINTWPFADACKNAFETLKNGGSALDAITDGTSTCERERCDGSVGWGGSPDENGESYLDAMIMDGETYNTGAVASLRRCRDAAKTARQVMEHTEQTLLVGDLASQFAFSMGFGTNQKSWKKNNCQPNYWINVTPDPRKNCGPYQPIGQKLGMSEKDQRRTTQIRRLVTNKNHDTIGMVALDATGKLAAGTSTNGLTHKIPGRVGDSPIPGAGSYAGSAGGAAATGDGDIMMRFLPSYQAHESMRLGKSPQEATSDAIARIRAAFPEFSGAVIALNRNGDYAAACHNIYNNEFHYMAQSEGDQNPKEEIASCSFSKQFEADQK
ncbi:Oidioi.mRNA.OKI2018_I69.chr1.g1099.t1.cds [Oikopleura dioica]|uniref:Oidioi.mRNA.OKI2018_I69.chr1.g1099.t1.cds n=1 Tax=Oikopleura dioica TaxID=34765 RepID=A0ABN7SLV4_OIKDI|nr:Oidioi.mRNA.OKI2018_I69.chr1.g1099.t1.cds [Oikopleura dioica]